MRLALLISIIGFSILISIMRPYIGLLVFSWLAYMRPQNLAWASSDWRFSYYVAIALLIGCVLNISKEKFFVLARENYLLILLWIVLAFSTIFSIWPGQSSPKFVELSKILFIAILTSGLVSNKRRLEYLIWLIAFIFGFFAIKGALRGMFWGWHLQGPEGSMLADNNDFALGLNMILPFFLYLGIGAKIKLHKTLFYILFVLTALTIIYTYSRGGFIGLCVVTLILVLRAKRKILGLIALAFGLLIFINFAPQEYTERIETIKTYEHDPSAMNRIYAWQAAWGMTKDRPLAGVGFRNFLMVYSRYHWSEPHVAHNSYLQLLAENGFIALGLFMLVLFFSILKLRFLRKIIPFNEKNAWVHNYSNMLEVGFMGYIVSSMFLSRPDFDLLYQFIGMTVALYHIAMTQNLNTMIEMRKNVQT